MPRPQACTDQGEAATLPLSPVRSAALSGRLVRASVSRPEADSPTHTGRPTVPAPGALTHRHTCTDTRPDTQARAQTPETQPDAHLSSPLSLLTGPHSPSAPLQLLPRCPGMAELRAPSSSSLLGRLWNPPSPPQAPVASSASLKGSPARGRTLLPPETQGSH